MERTIKETVGRYHINIYPAEIKGAPCVYTSAFMEAGGELVRLARRKNCPPFHLVSVSHLDWDADLSPWPAPAVISKDDNFQGGADTYCDFLLDKVVPFARGHLGVSDENVICGYSMGGLFALWVPYRTAFFDRVVCASGSVWFPNFVEYMKRHPYPENPAAIYLSLGDRETHSKNAYLQTTATCMSELEAHFAGIGIETTFVQNKGNHYDHPLRREALGITWVLTH